MVCRLIPGLLGVTLQGLLFLGVCLALLCKKQHDDPPRAWPTFLADSSKQMIGAGWLHALNLVCSWALDAIERPGGAEVAEDGDACDWYFINVVVDCSLGVFVEYLLLKGWSFILTRLNLPGLSDATESGNYYEPVGHGEDPPRFQRDMYLKQLLMWLLIVTQMKLLLVALFLATHSWLIFLTRRSLCSIPSDEAKLAVVMIVVPYVMNTLQVWLVDAFLKKNSRSADPGPLP